MFAHDRDLLVLEPRLFSDISWTGQKLVDASNGAMDSSGTLLTVAGVNFVALGVGAGFVALVGGVPLEVVGRESATELIVSKLRASIDDDPIRAASGSALPVVITTFRPQIALVHGQLLAALGLWAGDAAPPGGAPIPTESAVTNPRDLAHAEALGALHLILASAAAMVGSESALWTKALTYRDRFMAERRRLAARLDLDADGAPDALRRVSAQRFVRE